MLGAGAYFWHQAGRHVDETLDEAKEQIDNLKFMKEAGEYEDPETGEMVEFTPDDYKKELSHTYISTGLKLGKSYGPAALMTIGAGVCFVTGNHILAERLAGMTAAYSAAQTAYMKYRQNVVIDQGEEADRKYLYGLNDKFRESIVEETVDKNGKKRNKTVIRETDIVSDVEDWRQASPYAVRMDHVKGFTKDYQYNIMWLDRIEDMANNKLDYKGYLTLYDVYDALGVVNYLDPSMEKMSHQVGWIKGRGDGDIRFSIVMVPTACMTQDGETRTLTEVGLVDFNCIGSIWDKIG